MEYIIVEFPESREVFIDGQSAGQNRDPQTGAYRVFALLQGRHNFRLGGPSNYAPALQTVDVMNTAAVAPLRIAFHKTTSGLPGDPGVPDDD
jgi:hypothetical protein